ncbi:MAG TPA: AMP-binding protein, partial [Actinophytocola sp.]|nr:AMP-binding protein [Actinophytocola sp.]
MPRTDLLRPLPELLQSNASRHGEKVAFADSRRGVTHAELATRTGRIAGHLADLGVWPGDPVAVLLDGVAAVESTLAISRASAIAVPLDPGLDDAELAAVLADCGADTVITDADRAARVAGLADPPRTLVVSGDTDVPASCYEELAATDPATPPRDDLGLDDLAFLVHTAGVTGPRKGVLSTQRNALWSAAAAYAPVLGLSDEDSLLWPLPVHDGLGQHLCVLAATAVGASVLLAGAHSADELRQALAARRSTVVVGTPAVYRTLADLPGLSDMDAVRAGLVVGAAADADLRAGFERVFSAPLLEVYATTETCGPVALSWPGGDRDGRCLPVPGLSVRVVDPLTGTDVGAGQEGEVWVSGPNVMAGGYHDRPEATAAVLRNGWYRTGDLARRDESGYLAVTGRLADVVVVGEERVRPAHVEAVLRETGGVLDAAVTGRPDAELGAVPVAYVVVSGVDPVRLVDACRAVLPAAAVPVEVYAVPEIPRTAGGAVVRYQLADLPARLLEVAAATHDTLFEPVWEPVTGPAGEPGSFELVAVGAAASLVDTELTAGLTAVSPADLPGLLASRLAGDPAARLVVLARGAVHAGGYAPDPDLAAAWGHARGLRAAHPGRLVLVDADAVTEESVRAVVALGVGEVAVRAETALWPRFVPVPAG